MESSSLRKNQKNDVEAILPIVEALMLASGEPLSLEQITDVIKCDSETLEQAIANLEQRYQEESFGFELVFVSGKLQFRTKAEYANYIQLLKSEKPRRLSPAALETLAIVAYRQPVVKSEIEKIRGVDVTPTLKTLLDRDLIKIVGQQASAGQPALYGTTDEFLKVFGLNSLKDLPSLKELEEIESDPGEVQELENTKSTEVDEQ